MHAIKSSRCGPGSEVLVCGCGLGSESGGALMPESIYSWGYLISVGVSGDGQLYLDVST